MLLWVIGCLALAFILFFLQKTAPDEPLQKQIVRAVVKAVTGTIVLAIAIWIAKWAFILVCVGGAIYILALIFGKKKPLVTPPPPRR